MTLDNLFASTAMPENAPVLQGSMNTALAGKTEAPCSAPNASEMEFSHRAVDRAENEGMSISPASQGDANGRTRRTKSARKR